ncbi:hypothetical protein [Chryseosolibacter indicus]|uniref:HTTM-like domain-containing protein n=1 Tax=Chryseosolibacter indicus TaxID=2782351 RepID=A0ABS5VWU5_9BACT|nr:hypothetical protein [Chryseosolibacter indicus]MBT1705307.1 hypothetical protein [Chryseosolibacter indicus]
MKHIHINFNIRELLMRPAKTEPLAFLRIATAIVALAELLLLSSHWKDIYGSHGYIEWVISSNLFSMPNLPTMAGISELLNREVVSNDMIMYSLLGLYIVSLSLMMLGFKSNIMAFFSWLLHLTINNSANMYGYGVETFIHVSLFYLIFMPSSSHWAISKHPETTTTKIYANLLLTILQIHLCIVYLNAGIAKIEGDDWTSGEAIWRAVAQPSYSQVNMFWIAYMPWLSFIATYLVLLLETAYPLFIWFRLSRIYWLTGIILMHAGIGIFMGLYAFSAIMTVLNISAFGWSYIENVAKYARGRFAWSGKNKLAFKEYIH